MSAVESFGVFAFCVITGAIGLYMLVVVLIIIDDVVRTTLHKRANPTKCPCRRRICGDTTLCDCGESWDTNDMYPPEGH